jgi:hypothetical protein
MYEGNMNVIAYTNLNQIASKAFPRLDKISVSHWPGDHCMFIPPSNDIRHLFWISTKVPIELITELR